MEHVPMIVKNGDPMADPRRAKLYAESAARVLAPACEEARAHVRMKKRSRAQAFATVRRKFEALRRDYFARVWESTEADWNEHGPEQAFRTLYAEFFGLVSPATRRQPCTCLGSCRGADGLGLGWVCALESETAKEQK